MTPISHVYFCLTSKESQIHKTQNLNVNKLSHFSFGSNSIPYQLIIYSQHCFLVKIMNSSKHDIQRKLKQKLSPKLGPLIHIHVTDPSTCILIIHEVVGIYCVCIYIYIYILASSLFKGGTFNFINAIEILRSTCSHVFNNKTWFSFPFSLVFCIYSQISIIRVVSISFAP